MEDKGERNFSKRIFVVINTNEKKFGAFKKTFLGNKVIGIDTIIFRNNLIGKSLRKRKFQNYKSPSGVASAIALEM
jgi:hypothetical protein